MADRITQAQADTCLAQIKIQFAVYINGGGTPPKLIKDWDWLDSGPTAWAIVWEEGPFEWAYRAHQGGVDEELTAEARTVPGFEKQVISTLPAPAWPDTVWCEPVNGWSIALYPV